MAGRNNRPTVRERTYENPHPTSLTSYLGVLIGFLLLMIMLVLQAQASTLM